MSVSPAAPAGFSEGGQMYELRRFLTDSEAPGLHTLRICKDFNNEPLTPNHGDRSGVNNGLCICK